MLHKSRIPTDLCSLKFASDDSTGEFEGYASVFNSVDQVGDTILPGAFERSLRRKNRPAMFINHDHGSIPVGDWLELREDDRGLFGRGVIDLNHRDGPSLYSAMKRGAMNGLSIGFLMGQKDFEIAEGGGRVIKNVDLKEVSVVTFPCEDKARVSAVKAEDFDFYDLKSCEAWLRESAGFSRAAATALVSRILKYGQSESAASDGESLRDVIKTIRGIGQ